MKMDLDRYFELEEKMEQGTLTANEAKEWNSLNANFMDRGLIEQTITADDVMADNKSVKQRLDSAFDAKFGEEGGKVVKMNNVLPLNSGIKQLLNPPINWAAVASIAAVFVVLFTLRPNHTTNSNHMLLADSSFQQHSDTTLMRPDSILF